MLIGYSKINKAIYQKTYFILTVCFMPDFIAIFNYQSNSIVNLTSAKK